MNYQTIMPAKARKPRRMAREPKNDAAPTLEPASTADAAKALTTAGRKTKTHLLIDLLGREEGATLDQMVTATGWLPHTARAVLTGLRKKGHAVTSEKVDGIRVYRIATGAS